MLDGFLGAWIRLRARWRGWELPFFALPLLPAALVNAFAGEERAVVGCLLGFGATILAGRILRRGRNGDARRAAWVMAIGTGLAANMAAGMGHVAPFLMAAGAWLGTRMTFQALPETPPPPPPEPPPPPPGPIEQARARLARVEAAASRRADTGLLGVARAMEGVLDDLTAHPDRLPQARRFLAVHLDGLDRITARLEAGAAPPETMPALLAELTRTAGELRERLRREESEALEIQVKVLSDRLREEGYQ